MKCFTKERIINFVKIFCKIKKMRNGDGILDLATYGLTCVAVNLNMSTFSVFVRVNT